VIVVICRTTILRGIIESYNHACACIIAAVAAVLVP